MMEQLLSEEKNRASERIDRVSTVELLQIINREDQTVADAVSQEIPRIAAAVDAIVERFRQSGRLFYLGAGTSGRLGVLDATECSPTFGTPAERVQGLLAGGESAIFRASEGSEDDPKAGQADLEARCFGPKDVLVGITASGRTPYVLGAVAYARSLGALTVGLSCNPESQLSRNVDVAITPVVGPEVIAGSTRMKAASAQKLVLNMISTAVMVKMGYVLGNLMVKLQLNSKKLIARGRRIVAEVAGCDNDLAARALAQADHDVRVAILMAKFGLAPDAALQRLAEAGDSLSRAIGSEGGP
jgi:N-acetylmuramic acid 6-phosphate etherase